MRAGTEKMYLNPPKAMEHEFLNPQKHCTQFLGITVDSPMDQLADANSPMFKI